VHHYSAIVPDACERQALLLPRNGRWSLPTVTRETDAHPYFSALLQEFQEQLGLHLAVRRVASLPKLAREGEDGEMVLACENRAPGGVLPPGARWVDRRDLAAFDLAPLAHRAALEEWFAESEGRCLAPPVRVPWAEPGWFPAAEAWIRDRLAESGLAPNGPIEQVKAWSISCILRAPTGEGSVYFKVVPPLFAGEPVLTDQLSRRHPGQMPVVLARDAERRWLLLREIGGTELRRTPDLGLWEETLRRFARVQMAWIGETERLLACGCVDRRLAGLPGQFDRLLDEIASPEHRAVYGISEEDAGRVTALAPSLAARIEELAGAGVPQTLVHGDLHGGNVRVDGERIVFFDWTDGALAHPFFDLLTMFRDVPDLPDARARVRDAYLEPWTDLFPGERLLAAFELSQQVAPMYHALSYQAIAVNTEPALQWELSGGVGDYLRRLPGE
jgi:hypothetical protein